MRNSICFITRSFVSSSVSEVIELLDLKPHPEGGYFRETYRSPPPKSSLDTSSIVSSSRSSCSHIYYLLARGDISRFHRLDADEIFHHYCGGVINLVELVQEAAPRMTRLGCSISNGEIPLRVIKAGTWFGAYLQREADFSLVGCTVVPGFEFEHWELGDKAQLAHEFPHAVDMVEKLT